MILETFVSFSLLITMPLPSQEWSSQQKLDRYSGIKNVIRKLIPVRYGDVRSSLDERDVRFWGGKKSLASRN